MAEEMTVSFGNVIALLALIIAIGTYIINVKKYGREVHVDDRDRIMEKLYECERTCRETQERYSDLVREHERLKEENFRLLRRVTGLNGNDDRRKQNQPFHHPDRRKS